MADDDDTQEVIHTADSEEADRSSDDSYTEVTNESWGSRLGNALKGIIVGLILFALGFPLLFWNEGRAIKTLKAYEDGAGSVISVKPESVNPQNDGKLVHLTGKATTEQTLNDAEFGISAQALKLERQVEMYQWREKKKSETEKQTGGGSTTTTTYTYEKVWSKDAINSQDFKRRQGHGNPQMRVAGKEFAAEKVTVGAFTLTPALVNDIREYQSLAVAEGAQPPPGFAGQARIWEGGYYLGKDPQHPQIGDLKVKFRVVRPLTVSLVARQYQDTFEPYQASNGESIQLLTAGAVSAANMFAEAKRQNTLITWLIRLGGFLALFIGLWLVLSPLAVVLDFLPFLGDLAGAGLGLVAFLAAAALALVTIAVGWLYYRPVIGILLMVAALALLLGIRLLPRRPTAKA